MTAEPLRVILADDEAVFRNALAEAIASQPTLELVGTGGDASEAIALVEEHAPDVAVVDVRMPEGGGVRAATEICERFPGTRVVGLSAYDDTAARVSMLQAGASSYVVKSAPIEQIVQAVTGASAGDRSIDALDEPTAIVPPTDPPGRELRTEDSPGIAAGSATLRVILVDNDANFRGALAEALLAQAHIDLAGVAEGPTDAIDLAARVRPHVAIVDTRMPDGGGPRAVREIRALTPETGIVALSAYMTREDVLPMLQAGATSYLVKGAAIEEIVTAVISARRGGAHLSDEVASNVVRELVGQLERQEDEVSRHRQRVERIQNVIEGGGPQTVLQPMFDIGTPALFGLEALARFDGGSSWGPDLWFAEAASVGLGVELEVAALRSALSHLDGLPGDTVLFVNLSPAAATAAECGAALEDAPLERLVVEITEHAPVSDYEALHNGLRPLRDGGVRVAVDDVGAGFASLNHIVQLHPDFIKLDNALSQGIVTDEAAHAMARALAAFAGETDRPLIAEGVETDDQLAALRKLGVPIAQGYLLGRPAPAENLELSPPAALRA